MYSLQAPEGPQWSGRPRHQNRRDLLMGRLCTLQAYHHQVSENPHTPRDRQHPGRVAVAWGL